ncbi:hypothetical protein AUEXF2481DRAFT_36865 [Aureobasidium subglaciale EXF-2481]|uniref:Cep57 centrosome microtubule-binding domain-containing protein n=1 Tax=Aureobasidium subglaciale (strain EXF-2481) TaxID=1043005 RepID=A0A074YQA9_AURSE|nr:uncharacterized protein AUEXF2481DRAFT_36865 [Aureobasidium subglaciale EXF-2481]KEQ98354.1 hypothetical protein AUEXF2481DRAFT_36865 [Aureobasidium subglaciale EXF-2481]
MPSSRQSAGNTSTMSSFQPEFESTQQFDTATQSLQLPNLRSSAQRFAYYQPPQPEVHIDSSFVRDSFPDFTERSPSPSPSPDANRSIEAGRGKKGSPKSFDMSDIALPSDSLYDLHSTPPRSARPTPKKTDNLRKEASLRRAHSTDKRANASQRRSLSDMHHKVHRESDSSFVGEDRPITNTTQPRNTRFTSANLPTSYSHDQGLQSTLTPQRPLHNPTATWTGSQTQASFMLPDLPNITELVSGMRKDGTPVFSRSQKSRSRFTSASYNNPTITSTVTHANINSIAVPDEEKAIFASLQLLKDKVANLELEKSEAQKRLEEYETEVGQLKSRLDIEQKLRRPDSALGEDDDSSAKEKWRLERATLQSTVKTLQDRLDRGRRKLSVNDIAVKRLTQERDNLVTQLGVAYYNSEEIRNENLRLRDSNEHLEADVEALQAENSRLRTRLAQIKAQFNDETQQWSSRESDLKAKIQRREVAVRDMQHDLTTQSAIDQDGNSKSVKSRTTLEHQQLVGSRRPSGRLGQHTKHNILDSIEDEIKKARIASASGNTRSRSRSRSNTRQTTSRPQRTVELSDIDSTTNLDFSRPIRDETEEDSKDITYLSFLDPKELAKLRRTLEEERRASKTARAVSAPQVQDSATSTNIVTAPRKSSLKDVTTNDTGRFTIRSQIDENTGLLKNVRIQSPHMSDAISYSEPRESIEASFMGTSSRRRSRSKSTEEMTSAFILPDITLHTGPGAEATLMDDNGDVSHDGVNCTACPSNDSEEKEVSIPRPTPVSERDIDDTNATVRPSQPPPVALATVLKQLEDEVTHLKIQLRAYETMYNKHDPALGRRKRLGVKQRIDTLIAEVERRSDQIYALYDVLEGQKASADVDREQQQQEVADENVESTLQSLGIDVNELTQRAREAKQVQQHPFDVAGLDDESDGGLSWEGFNDESEVEEMQLPRRRSVNMAAGA